ncbi:hypothetical protein [Paenibacillus odorifer]|uniref:hypothetical protein n=1 Tax=Paenibacillus TaxID=44249 RepID=UPI00096F3CDF|nr:hypothetical protein [Paenibacillus odorifer]OMC97124.1 hypothetical protein BJP46_26855 [Paenibacillus odorifer]
MITGSKAEMMQIIQDLEQSVIDWLMMERSTIGRINVYQERMTKFGAKEYYEKQIDEEEKLLSDLKISRKNREVFLEELKKSYKKLYEDSAKTKI